jgi:hypothetical protein
MRLRTSWLVLLLLSLAYGCAFAASINDQMIGSFRTCDDGNCLKVAAGVLVGPHPNRSLNDLWLGAFRTCSDGTCISVTGITAGASLIIQDEGTPLAAEPALNFKGGGISCVDNPGVSTDCTITGAASSAYDTIMEEGSALTQRTTLNFIGAAITCADDPINSRTACIVTTPVIPAPDGSGQILYSNTSDPPAWTLLNASTAGKVLTLAGSPAVPGWATPAAMAIGGSITSATAGSVLYAGTSGVLAQDNANLFYDAAKHSLGVGTNTPDLAGLTSTNRTWLSILAPTIPFLELASGAADAAGNGGNLEFIATANSSGAGTKRIATIIGQTEGSTATNRGGVLFFFTKADAGALIERHRITSVGTATIATPDVSSVHVFAGQIEQQAGSLLLDGASSGRVKITPPAAAGTSDLALPAESGTVCTTGSVCTGYAGTTATQTLENKRVTPRVVGLTTDSSTNPTLACNVDNADMCTFALTGSTGIATLSNPTGTPTTAQGVRYRIKCTNNQTYAFGTQFRFSTTVTAPVTCAAGKTDYIGAFRNEADTTWDVVAVDQGH